MTSLIRFTLLSRDSDSGRKLGILVAAAQLRDEGDISNVEHQKIRIALDWFNSELNIPKILKNPGKQRAISWFKPQATEAISRMWKLKTILDQHDLHVEVHKIDNPGTIIYEDEWQIVAISQKNSKVS